MPITDSVPVLGVDLRGVDLRLTAATADGPRTWSVPAAAARGEHGVLLGQAAADALVVDPGAGWTGLIDRVGDPVPCVLGDDRVSASDVVARVLAGAAPAGVAGLNILSPSTWGPARKASFADAVGRVGLPAPHWVDATDTLAPELPLVAGAQALLLTIGGTGGSARVVSRDGTQWRTLAATPFAFGEDDISGSAYDTVAAQLHHTTGRGPTPAEARALGSVCALAADRLPHAERLEVALPEIGTIRVPRSLIEDEISRRLTDALAPLPAALAAQGVAALPRTVILEGHGAEIPSLAATIRRTWDADVSVAAAPAIVHAASGADHDDSLPAPLPETPSSAVLPATAVSPATAVLPATPVSPATAVLPATAVPPAAAAAVLGVAALGPAAPEASAVRLTAPTPSTSATSATANLVEWAFPDAPAPRPASLPDALTTAPRIGAPTPPAPVARPATSTTVVPERRRRRLGAWLALAVLIVAAGAAVLFGRPLLSALTGAGRTSAAAVPATSSVTSQSTAPSTTPAPTTTAAASPTASTLPSPTAASPAATTTHSTSTTTTTKVTTKPPTKTTKTTTKTTTTSSTTAPPTSSTTTTTDPPTSTTTTTTTTTSAPASP